MGKDICAIIGINSNLGIEFAKKISLKYKIFAVGRKSLDHYAEFKNLINEKKLDYEFAQCDLSNIEEVDILKKKFVEAEIKSLVCIGGSYPEFNSSSYLISDKKQANLIQTHSLSYASIVENLFESLENLSVVYISSTSIFWKGNRNLFYSAAKNHGEHLLLSITKKYLESKNRLNIVRLAIMEKPFSNDDSKYSEEDFNRRVSLMPNKLPIRFKEASDLISFLISNESKAVNGNVISLDRGESINRLSI